MSGTVEPWPPVILIPPTPLLAYVGGDGRRTGAGWVNRDGEPLDTIDKLAAHLAAAEAAAVANGH